jgi:hypothetical protein
MNEIKIAQTDDGGWIASLKVQESYDSYRSYYIEAPSQTMLLETIRMMFGRPRYGKKELS